MAEKRKTAKTAFRPRPKLKKRLKTVFQPLGNGNNASKRLSNPLEMKKTPQNGFPTPWKWRKCLKTVFQPLGNGKNALKRLSNPLEMGKMPQNGFSNPLEAGRWMLKLNSRNVK